MYSKKLFYFFGYSQIKIYFMKLHITSDVLLVYRNLVGTTYKILKSYFLLEVFQKLTCYPFFCLFTVLISRHVLTVHFVLGRGDVLSQECILLRLLYYHRNWNFYLSSVQSQISWVFSGEECGICTSTYPGSSGSKHSI